MKHTPEEQLQFIKDNDLTTGFMTAIFNNDKGIGCSPVIIHDAMWKNGQAQLVVEFLNGDVSTMPCTALPGTDDESECVRLKDASGNSRQFNCRDESEPASSTATHCFAYNKILFRLVKKTIFLRW